jgi:DNA (cytosine-5)-methyltransferase 1
MSSTPQFTFSDLFAGIGGFHAALHAAGGRWAFASEIDEDALRVYDHNWLRPLRESGAPLPPGVHSFEVSGDIVEMTYPEVKVPHADVLAAGFPCQPFSKSGFQRGMAETRGTLFWNIARILADESVRPSVVILENVRNLAGPRHAETFATIVATLRQLGYRTASTPAVFSPHLLPRHLGGRPQVRERVFILAHYVGPEAAQDPVNFDEPIVSPKSLGLDWSKDRWDLARDLPLEDDSKVAAKYFLESSELKWIHAWDDLLTDVAAHLGPDERLPGFPIWLQHFADFQTLEGAQAYIKAQERELGPLPPWKWSHLIKNGEWFERFAEIIEPHWQVISGFPVSRQKFEWQAGPHRPLADTIMHFRPSGIRCKRPNYVPALVAITQTSVLGDRRRLTPREAARLQGMPNAFEFKQTPLDKHRRPVDGSPQHQKDAASYKQMGNGVNVGAAYYAFQRYVVRHRDEIPEHIVLAATAAPQSPDDILEEPR